MKIKLLRPSRRGWIFALVSGAIVLALPYLVPHKAVHHGWWDSIPGWWAIYGFVGCSVIIVVSKWLGYAFLQKDEDFYDE